VFTEEEAWDVIEEIPNGTAAPILLEHRWAIPLRDAVASTGGFRLGDAFVSPWSPPRRRAGRGRVLF
jgi:hypothetical protein